MAHAVPLATGILGAIALWFATGAEWTRARASLRPEGDAAPRASRAVLAAAQALGERLPRGLLDRGVVRAATDGASALADRCGLAARSVTRAAGLVLLAMAVSALAGLLVALSPIGLALGGALPFALCAVVGARRLDAGRGAVARAMPEAFHALAISLGSGHSLEQALRFVGNHAEEPIRTEFTRASFEMACGASAASALDALLHRLPAPGLDLVALALKVSQRTGAPLRDLLAQAADMVGERVELERALETKTTQARMSARLVTAMPVAMTVVLGLLSDDFRAGLATSTGAGAIALALGLNALAWVLIKRIMEVDAL